MDKLVGIVNDRNAIVEVLDEDRLRCATRIISYHSCPNISRREKLLHFDKNVTF